MSYTVKLHPKVSKFLDKCEVLLSERIKSKLKLLIEDPFRYLEHYEGNDYFKLRIGDYRALIDVNKGRKIIFIRYLNHRKKIYKETR